MLSAVAARKLKQGQQTPSTPGPSTPQLATSSSAVNSSPKGKEIHTKKSSNKPSSKRKSSNQTGPNSASKKPRRSRSRGKEETPRYFAGSARAEASDDDAVRSAEEDEEDEHESVLGGFDDTSVPSSKRRAYSPSRPVEEDSSDEDIPAPSAPLRLKSAQLPSKSVTLSTFRPTSDENLFVLTADERSMLGLSGEGAIVVLLSERDTLSFIGTLRIRVLHGSVSMLGATLRASAVSRPVFAPRSSPVPTLVAVEARDGSSAESSLALPSRIGTAAKDASAVVMLQEMFSGVEGLGRVVRPFEGVFRPGPEDSVLDLPLAGVAMVSRIG